MPIAQTIAIQSLVVNVQPYPWHIAPPLTELATLSEAEWERRLPASALRRIKPAMERRNAQGNLNAQANIKQ
ncbi:hypothetical protein [Thermosynechococcus vestitus]|uniref:hypothetical protein n=1 Tax=Thermosynechococcus vestitus TaxID=146786 RepID=UPI0018D2AAA4|nr:hypothetical protein [Thermosynechococcus vestitus]